jgi:large subunit ribosomal protein L30
MAATDEKTISEKKMIKVRLVRSLINTRSDHRATVRGLGLRRLNHTVEVEDTPAVRGMINKVGYLLRLES